MKIAAKTDIGNQRSENQDNYRAGRQADNTVWALVCDGMGGAKGGKLASSLAASYMEEAFVHHIDTLQTEGEIRRLLLRCVDKANALIYTKAQQDQAVQGMGTTIVCAVLRGDKMQYVHAGDSRLYLYHSGAFVQLTKDHSMVQELLEQGSITEEEAAAHPHKNLITRALGVAENIDLDYGQVALEENDVVLLCTDGLSNYVTDTEIMQVLQTTPLEQAADTLIAKALAAGGLDNITVLLVQTQPQED